MYTKSEGRLILIAFHSGAIERACVCTHERALNLITGLICFCRWGKCWIRERWALFACSEYTRQVDLRRNQSCRNAEIALSLTKARTYTQSRKNFKVHSQFRSGKKTSMRLNDPHHLILHYSSTTAIVYNPLSYAEKLHPSAVVEEEK